MGLDRNTVDRRAGGQIADLQKARHVTDREKQAIRRLHEQAARRAETKARRGR